MFVADVLVGGGIVGILLLILLIILIARLI